MATIIERRPVAERRIAAGRGWGIAGIIAAIVIVLLAAFLFIRYSAGGSAAPTGATGTSGSSQSPVPAGPAAGSY